MARDRSFPALLMLLAATGWAANHFTAAMPTLLAQQGLPRAVLDGVFGVYALGLLPGLLGGGALSDRVGRAAVVLPGAATALAGTLVFLARHDAPGLLAGRLTVGAGAGLAFGAGTAWAADMRGKAGAAAAGICMTAGFALGPVVSGLLGHALARPAGAQFGAAAAVSAAALALAAAALRGAKAKGAVAGGPSPRTRPGPPQAVRGAGEALGWALPLAPWVFASVTLAVVALPARLPAHHSGPLLTGAAAALALGSGLAAQAAARRFDWGPGAGVAGAAAAAAGYALAGAFGAAPTPGLLAAVCVVLGAAYGLCLREGLLDLETLAPARARGRLTGVFYVGTYLGFGLPLALVLLEPRTGWAAPLYLLAALAGAAAVDRAARLRSAPHPGRPGASTRCRTTAAAATFAEAVQ